MVVPSAKLKETEKLAAWRAPSAIRAATKSRLGMIKKIESYSELADPQTQPRYSGIPTFFRLILHAIGR